MMKLTYDPNDDMMYIGLNERYPYRTDETSIPGLAIFYDEQGKIVGIEIEDASQIVDAPNRVDFECYTQVAEEQDEAA